MLLRLVVVGVLGRVLERPGRGDTWRVLEMEVLEVVEDSVVVVVLVGPCRFGEM